MNSSLQELFNSKSMSIIASLPENRMDLAQAAIDAGADALKFHINVSHRASGNKFENVNSYIEVFNEVRGKFGGPIGIVIGDEIEKVLSVDVKGLKELGFNFFSLYAKDIGSNLLLQDDLEQTVALNTEFSIDKAQYIDSFNYKAVELSIVKKEDYGKPLNFEDIISYKSYRENTKLPIIIPSQKKLVPEDMVVLENIGINAVMLGAVTIGKTAESIYENISKFSGR